MFFRLLCLSFFLSSFPSISSGGLISIIFSLGFSNLLVSSKSILFYLCDMLILELGVYDWSSNSLNYSFGQYFGFNLSFGFVQYFPVSVNFYIVSSVVSFFYGHNCFQYNVPSFSLSCVFCCICWTVFGSTKLFSFIKVSGSFSSVTDVMKFDTIISLLKSVKS